MQSLMYDSLDFEFLVNNGSMIFRTDNNSSFYGETAGSQFCLIRVRRKNTDIYLTFIKNKVKPSAGTTLESMIKQWCIQVLNSYQFTRTQMVRLAFFKKQLYGRVQNIDDLCSVFGNFDLSLNWIDYIHATRIYDLPETPVIFNDEIIFAMLTKSASGVFNPLLATVIDKDSFAA